MRTVWMVSRDARVAKRDEGVSFVVSCMHPLILSALCAYCCVVLCCDCVCVVVQVRRC